MTIALPQPGEVISYSYLWADTSHIGGLTTMPEPVKNAHSSKR